MHKVFISYKSEELSIAQDVCNHLEKSGIECWIAPRNIPAGARYGKLITQAINECQVLLLIFSKNADASEWVDGEVNAAITRKKTIISFCIDDYPIFGSDMELLLQNKHAIIAYPNYKEKLDLLLRDVRGHLGMEGDSSNKSVDSTPDRDLHQEQQTENKHIDCGNDEFKSPQKQNTDLSIPHESNNSVVSETLQEQPLRMSVVGVYGRELKCRLLQGVLYKNDLLRIMGDDSPNSRVTAVEIGGHYQRVNKLTTADASNEGTIRINTGVTLNSRFSGGVIIERVNEVNKFIGDIMPIQVKSPGKTVEFNMIKVKAGEVDGVSVQDDFYIAETEVTQELW